MDTYWEDDKCENNGVCRPLFQKQAKKRKPVIQRFIYVNAP
jgi:hypothetical protein